MNKHPNIVIVTSFNDHFRLFARIAKALKKKKYKVTFVTNRHSIVSEAKITGNNVYPVIKTKEFISDKLPINLEQKSGLLTKKQAGLVYSDTINTLDIIHAKENIDNIFIWGGIRIMDASAKAWAKKNNIKTLFFELANLPNKLFADHEGTNAQSSLSKNCSSLNDYTIDEKKYDQWLKNYVEQSLTNHNVPQSKGVLSIDVKKNLFDLYGVILKNYMKFEHVVDIKKLKNKLLGNFIKFNFDNVSLEDESYVFYPMQVSVDAQILVNSTTNNLEALKKASAEANKRGLKLLVKPHPAERDIKHIKEVYKLKNQLGFYFINGNTIEIIKKSDLVITINSTVGLQALLLDKEVICYGEAFYSKFTKSELISYIQNYLLDIDFWSENDISDSDLNKILERAR